MVQLEHNLTLTLQALAPSGNALSPEQLAALELSLPLKQHEAGLKHLSFWGKILARNGKDYLVAQGCMRAAVLDSRVESDRRVCFSQDGVRWLDLAAPPPAVAQAASLLTSQLSGDPATAYTVKDAEGGRMRVTELQRLRAAVDAVTGGTAVVPARAFVADARRDLVANPLFAGVPYPAKLESYLHAQGGPDGESLAADVRHTWSLHYDAAAGRTVLRSLLWPGYQFFYQVPTARAGASAWGGLYFGTGAKNSDLIFMV
ncbi:hypothetical protein WJX81_006405 [Elliptochloris bilobata]|uniref:Radial spoke head protein 9 homolog n=1 Tax=Elliptochloris bilobata TaxID=381761 RepID=A0AAW1QYD4_9CHLO